MDVKISIKTERKKQQNIFKVKVNYFFNVRCNKLKYIKSVSKLRTFLIL